MGCLRVKGGGRHQGRAAGDGGISQYCTDSQADGITISPMSVQTLRLYLTFHVLHSLLLFPGTRAVCFCSAERWPRSKQQQLHFYTLVSEQDSRSLNHPSQAPTAGTRVIRNLWDHPVACKKKKKKSLSSFWEEKQLENWRNYMPWAVKADTKEASVELSHYPEPALRRWMTINQCYIFFLYFLNCSILP